MTLSELLKQIKPYVLGWARPRYLPFAIYQAMTPLTADGGAFIASIDGPLTLRRWHQAAYVATTNDGTNYWSLELRRADTNAALVTLTTSALTAATWSTLAATGIDAAVTTGMIGLYIRAIKTGAPGDLYLGGPAVWVE